MSVRVPTPYSFFASAILCCGMALMTSGTLAHAQSANPETIASRAADEAPSDEHPLAAALELAKACRGPVQDAADLQATFSKRELVGGQMIPHTMAVKFRAEPFSVYMRFLKAHEGREVIYVAGRNGGKLLAHETGIRSIVGTVALDPTSPHAMSEGRYPITEFGMSKLLEGIIRQWEAESQFGECDVKFYPQAKLGTMECQVIESSHPRPRRQFRTAMTRLYIDKTTNLPVRVEQYAFPSQPGGKPQLIEEYTYSNVRTNVGLTDADFDVRNPQYAF